MKRIVFAILTAVFIMAGCGGQTAQTGSAPENIRMITDMAGRSVAIPEQVNKIYSTGQPGVVMLYTLCPEKLLGWCLKVSDREAEYIEPVYLSLPVLGLMQGSNNTANREEIMARKPDVILLMTIINEENKKSADEIQAVMKIPVVIADIALENLPDSYEFLGKVTGESHRAEALGGYCRNVLSAAKQNAAKILPEEILNVYYAQGSKGLQTAPKGSSHSQVIDLVGGNNVVALQAEADGRLSINMEQLVALNPDVVIASYSMDHQGKDVDGAGIESIIANSSASWKLLSAVKQGLVFSTPNDPYNWLDMPPSANRIIGIQWMGNLLYPEYFQMDIRKQIQEFYLLFYRIRLSHDQINSLLNHAVRK